MTHFQLFFRNNLNFIEFWLIVKELFQWNYNQMVVCHLPLPISCPHSILVVHRDLTLLVPLIPVLGKLRKVGRSWAYLHLQGWGVGRICLSQPTKRCCWGNNIGFNMAWTIAIWIFHNEFFWTSETTWHGHWGQKISICSVGAPILLGWIIVSLPFP